LDEILWRPAGMSLSKGPESSNRPPFAVRLSVFYLLILWLVAFTLD
jgi:hypothetical protein